MYGYEGVSFILTHPHIHTEVNTHFQSTRIVLPSYKASNRKSSLKDTFGKDKSLTHDLFNGLNCLITSLSEGDSRITLKPTFVRLIMSFFLIGLVIFRIYL